MRRLVQKLNAVHPNKISVEEHLQFRTDPEKAFYKMVENKSCDGLVISGHHTISWGGKRTYSSLELSFLERLSCEPEHREWFSSIQAIWLQGCRTLGDTTNNSNVENIADFHAHRVGRMLEEDHLFQNVMELNHEFSELLDQSNPVAYRYLKVFPKARLFGWTASAPGEKSYSERSIPYHLMQVMKLESNKNTFPMDVFQKSYSESDAYYLTRSIDMILGSQEDGSLASLAWQEHGAGGPYAYGNEDLTSYAPLYSQSNGELLKRAKFLSCELIQKERKNIFAVLDEILENEELIGQTFNSISFLLRSYLENEEDDIRNKQIVMEKLRGSKKLYDFLEDRLESNRVGFLKKISYLELFIKLGGSPEIIKKVEELISEQSMHILESEDYLGFTPIELIYYKEGILKNLIQYDFNKEKLATIASKVRYNRIYIIRLKLIKAAGKIGGSFGKEILEENINSSEAMVQKQSIRESIGISEAFAWELIHKGIEKGRDLDVQLESMSMAIKLGGEKAWKIVEEAMQSNYEKVRKLTLFDAVRLELSMAQVNLARTKKIMESAIEDNSPEVRREVIVLTKKFFRESPEFQMIMIDKGLADESPEVKKASIEAIGSLSCSSSSSIISTLSEVQVRQVTKEKISKTLQKKCSKVETSAPF